MINKETYTQLISDLNQSNTTLIAVSKLKPVADIDLLYNLGQRDFGENYVQELVEKQVQLPLDIHWHFIGHLQSNKVKYIAPFVHLIHGVDSLSLLKEINKQAAKNNRIIPCLLQVHIAEEETKYGFNENEITELMEILQNQKLPYVSVNGLMGMASFSDDINKVRNEFKNLNAMFRLLKQNYFPANNHFNTLSMGMSGDYKIGIEEGSNMVRIGSLLFGDR